MNKIAIIFPGNLASYFLCLYNYKLLCEFNNIDIYILYSKNINYIHTLFPEKNISVGVDHEDIDLINSVLGKNIKYFSAIEDEPKYENYMQTYKNLFRKNSKWVENIDENQLVNPNINKGLTIHRYMDQFVRIKFLYDTIQESDIHYDYIVRLRIDQLIDEEFLKLLVTKLNRNYYPFIWNTMDNIFVVHNNYFTFFDYLINNLGSHKEVSTFIGKKYQLGPEIQFGRSVINFFQSDIYTFNDVLNKYIQIAMGSLINKNIYLYDNRVTGEMSFGSYLLSNKISKDNYETKLEKFKSTYKLYDYYILEKYKLYLVLFYYIMINK